MPAGAVMPLHVPDAARITVGPMGSPAGVNYGAFALPSPEPGWQLLIIADDGTHDDVPESLGWEHVSVRAARGPRGSRVPTWREMSFVKDTFWDAGDTVVQFHPARASYVNHHEHVLHLWRHRSLPFPCPPAMLV